MAKRTHASDDRTAPVRTLTEIFLGAVDAYGAKRAFGRIHPSREVEYISYDETLARAKCVAGALEARGLGRGDRAAIMSINRLEWALADYGCLCAGVVDVPVYPTLTAPQVAYILRDSGAQLLFVSDKGQLAKALEAIAECGRTVDVVAFDPPDDVPTGVTSWDDFMAEGAARAARWSTEEFRSRALQARPEDVATILYTSGTTGDPKGVMLTHANVGSNVLASGSVLYIDSGDSTVSFLPLSHIMQRMVDYLFVHRGVPIVHARSMMTAIEDMRAVQPTVALAVPRVYEKIHDTVLQATGAKKKLIDWAVGVADQVADLRLAGRMPTGHLGMQYWLADTLVFSKIRAAMGGRMRWFVSGSAPLAPELNRFFYSIGLTILEGYGLTETSPVTNVNTEDHFRIGTVGKPIPGTEIRIAEDGEILVRGPQVMKGYWNRPQDTAEAIDADGWFHTGDIGELDDDGFLRITDRKKDLIVTAGGKNVAPQPIENRLKTNPFVEQAVLVGDRRKFISVLVVPAFTRLEAWARDQGITWSDRRDLLAQPAVRRHMEAQVKRELRAFASFETPKRVALLEEEFTIGNGALTPTLKIKRKVVQERFGDLIEELYGGRAYGSGRR
jgi:long-chain acyl-CoA synthetase